MKIKRDKIVTDKVTETLLNLKHTFDISLTEICEKITSDDYIGLKMESKVQDLWAEI